MKKRVLRSMLVIVTTMALAVVAAALVGGRPAPPAPDAPAASPGALPVGADRVSWSQAMDRAFR